MKRTDIIDAANELTEALVETRVGDLLGGARSKGADPPSENIVEVIEALKQFTVLAHSFKPATKKLEQIFGLDKLEETGRWLIFAERTPPALRMRSQIGNVVDFLPRIAAMVEPETLAQLNRETKSRAKPHHRRILSVSIVEPAGLFSSPMRLSNVLESINSLYTVCAWMENESPSTLSVIACDSGSDKSFDFLGLAKVMECLERLIGTIWERAFFFREHQFEERLRLVAESLPIMERITTLEHEKSIAPEMAELWKRDIFEGTIKFLQSGATTPKIEDTSEYNPRTLLSPAQKLLVAAPENLDENTHQKENSEIDIEDEEGLASVGLTGLTENEEDNLIELIRKSREARSSHAIATDETPIVDTNDPGYSTQDD